MGDPTRGTAGAPGWDERAAVVLLVAAAAHRMRQNSESVVVGSQRVGYPSSSIGER